MRQHWEIDELVEDWTLDGGDLALVRNKARRDGSCHMRSGEGDSSVQVEREFSVWVDVSVGERRKGSAVVVVKCDVDVLVVEDVLDHEGVDVDERRLEQV